EKGLEKRWLAILFVIAITFTYGFVFNMVQANSITETTSQALKPLIHNSDNMKWVNLALALVISALTAAVIFGGIWRISAV
ncbi:alanine:cation symporter family protein, partial [Flavonifractor plautii]